MARLGTCCDSIRKPPSLGRNEINHRFVPGQVAKAGYDGFVGLEFRPPKLTLEALQHATQIVQQINQTLG